MSEETTEALNAKRAAFEELRSKFVEFMSEVAKMPGSPQQKQQAFIRFDEGHMWMQNSVLSYQEPKPVEPTGTPEVSPVE